MQIFDRRKIKMCRNVRNSYSLAGARLEGASVGSVFCEQDKLIFVCKHDIICVYVCLYILTKLMYFQQILYLLGVNKYYGCVLIGTELSKTTYEHL